MKEIAVVRLAPGKVAYYDDYTKIHLTLSNPTATIYEGMNLKRIKNSVKFGVLRVVVGSLTTDVTEVPVEVEKPIVFKAPVAEKEIDETIHDDVKTDAPEIEITETLPKTAPIETETDKVEDIVAEKVEKVEDVAEETESKPKRGRKKNTTDKEITE